MSKSYKMVVLLDMFNANQVPGSLRLHDELAQQVTRICEHHPRLAADIGDVLNSEQTLKAMLVKNPIAAWVGGKGGRSYFAYKGDRLRMTANVATENRGSFQELLHELVDWRLADFLNRSSVTDAESYTLKVSHAEGQPMAES